MDSRATRMERINSQSSREENLTLDFEAIEFIKQFRIQILYPFALFFAPTRFGLSKMAHPFAKATLTAKELTNMTFTIFFKLIMLPPLTCLNEVCKALITKTF